MVWNERVWEEDLLWERFIFNWPEIENAGLLVLQCLGHHAPSSGSLGWVPGRRTKVARAVWHNRNKQKWSMQSACQKSPGRWCTGHLGAGFPGSGLRSCAALPVSSRTLRWSPWYPELHVFLAFVSLARGHLHSLPTACSSEAAPLCPHRGRSPQSPFLHFYACSSAAFCSPLSLWENMLAGHSIPRPLHKRTEHLELIRSGLWVSDTYKGCIFILL